MPSTEWVPVQDRRCYGVAIWNFDGLPGCSIALSIQSGEAVHIKGECQSGWYYVRKLDPPGGELAEGVVPKSYIVVKDCSVIRLGDSDSDIVIPKQPTLSQEIVASLQEWHKIVKQLFVASNISSPQPRGDTKPTAIKGKKSEGMDAGAKFTALNKMILDLHECRKQVLLTSNLPQSDLKELKKRVASIIDNGNSMLKLDMVVRDEHGNPLDPLSTSTIQLFRQHQKSTQTLKRSVRGSNRGSGLVAHSSHSLIVTVDKVSWKITDECEMRFFLCDTTNDEPHSFTECVQIMLPRGAGPPKTPFKFIFTDLGKADFDRQKVYLVAFVVRIGAMDLKESEHKKGDSAPFSDKRNNISLKRSYGVAALDISYLFRVNSATQSVTRDVTGEGDSEIQTMAYLPCGGEDMMDDVLRKIIGTIKLEGIQQGGGTSNGKDTKTIGFAVRLVIVPGNPKQLQEEQPLLVRGNPVVCRKMGFPEVILPNDTRNDLYIKLVKGEFHRTAKTTDPNVEVSVSVHNDKGQLLPGIISGGNGCPPVDVYRSVVYYHNDKPRWNEYFKISLPMNIEEFSSAHIKFIFKHRSKSDNKDKSEKPFALAFLKLKEQEGTAIRDAVYELILYKIDPKHYKDSEVQYLSLPYTRSSPWMGTSKPSCPGFSWSSKDCCFVKTTLCSTNFTQNADLLELLLWTQKLRQVAESTVNNQKNIKPVDLMEMILEKLKSILEKVRTVAGEEIVKFLHPILDVLFQILVDPMEQIWTELRSGRQSIFGEIFSSANLNYYETPESIINCDRYVFNCLLYIFGLILDHKFQNFQSVLNLYIEEMFSSTLAYKKLAVELKNAIDPAHTPAEPPDKVLRVMKSIEFFFKFIVKSFEIHRRLRFMEFGRTTQDREDDEGFEKIVEGLFKAMCSLLRGKGDKNDPYIGAEGGCLKHVPTVIEDLIRVVSRRKLSEHLVQLCNVVPPNKLTNLKLTFISEIVHSELFVDAECRFNFLPTIASNVLSHLPANVEDPKRKSMESVHMLMQNRKLRKIFGEDTILSETTAAIADTRSLQPKEPHAHSEETEKSVELLGDVMDILHRQPPDEAKMSHIWYIIQRLLRPIIFSIGTISSGDLIAGNMVAIFLSLLREMKSYHYGLLINSLKAESASAADPYKQGLLKFLNDVLVVMKNFFQSPYFPNDWNAMLLLQNSIVLTALDHFATTIKAEFAEPFEEQPWTNFFICAVSFLTQPFLQLEDFPQTKQNYIRQNFGDMRKKAAELIRLMWFSLGESKRIRFVPGMVGTFLDMAFVPEPDLRKTTIPIFFDMMHCDFDKDRPKKSFRDVEDELVKRIVEGIEGGKGDVAFRNIFSDTMRELCEHNSTGLRHQGLEMVATVTKLMDFLLQYREVESEEDPGNRMSCIVNLLDFSKEIHRQELYLRYLYKLHDLHTESKNFTEAGFTLKLHSQQLDWSEDEVPPLLRVMNRHPGALSQADLKEALYYDIISYFDSAKMWECALDVCGELRQQYEDTYNYTSLPKLHRRLAEFYDKILNEPRFKPEYYRVGFYGGGFPTFLQNMVFVYRGRPLEQLAVFEARLLAHYMHAELLRNLGPPSDEIRNSNKQYLQICKVDPVMTTSRRLSGMRSANQNILNYYQSNEIEKFTYSRPYHQDPRDPDNEFASLWLDRYTLWISQSFPGIMSWFPVERSTLTKVKPVQNAIESLESINETMRNLVVSHYRNSAQDIGEMSMKLTGILDAAVNGGVAKYEAAFLTSDYLIKHPNDDHLVEKLKHHIVVQIPILEECLKIHVRKIQPNMEKMHQRLVELFRKRSEHLESVYNVVVSDIKDETLSIEINKAFKAQEEIQRKRAVEPRDTRYQDFMQGAQGHRGSIAFRTPTFTASTTSLYQNASGSKSVGRSMATITQRSQNLFRRSTHSSFSGSVDGSDQFSMVGMLTPSPNLIPTTLPRQNSCSFMVPSPSASLSKLSSSDQDSKEQSNGDDQQEPIPLTQTLVTQRPPRQHSENRNSWANGNNRHSEISLLSIDVLQSTTNNSAPHSRNSVNSPESGLGEETVAPPLPPKQGRDAVPPPPPPKKPPMKQFRDAPF